MRVSSVSKVLTKSLPRGAEFLLATWTSPNDNQNRMQTSHIVLRLESFAGSLWKSCTASQIEVFDDEPPDPVGGDRTLPNHQNERNAFAVLNKTAKP